MKKLLLTGFEPFLDFPINPTTEIANYLNGELIGSYKIIGEILSVDFHQSGSQILELIEKHQPDAIVSLGLAAGRNCITPERIAINCNDGPVDNKGHKPNGEKIFEIGQDAYFSKLPIYEMVDKLKKEGLPAKISNTAGTYLCNNVMYHVLHYLAQHNLDLPAGFIHIPASHALAIEKPMPSWSQSDLLRGIKLALTSLSEMER
ncbi:pyroglutamyl-peptidase I [Ornithinibacillus bavariensis]|uniref:Pyrrolidone-carboxylate peptidase n=1 Tax=Ornithinibacillus bavariensis TaxID=545502 RepID=A0A920C6C6_9BACI|nr:pyroglutamyl-peptidase I [Ornithinibacillus bavariensis]GIO26458.1 pyrrolidone-carboxylate peptidase [Ornithinibacillus bavariensis]HAM81679.1 peptidase C15 [Ornithinibacillus sp.]